ncbi:MAG: sigma-70 family RNA polymerase sigma factor [Lachnospiraceae bacterium]|nr:sigma-70 family RNA polymerase sigma factor [Lachnospiraceae bacterium]
MSENKKQITAEEAIDRYADMVYRLALLRVKNQTDAEDIFQEVFIRLVKHIDKLQSWDHVKAWLITVTTNCAKKHFEQYWNKNVSCMEDTQEIQVVETGYESAEGDGTVLTAVKSLPEKYRIAIHLFYFEELSVTEIAKATKQKESTVKSQLFRAREMLKEMLEGEVFL